MGFTKLYKKILIFSLIISLLAFGVLALTVSTSVSNVALISPAANADVSGTLLLNVTADHISAGNGNITNVTVFFWNVSNDALIYNVTLIDDGGTNLTFNTSFTSSTYLVDGLYNISINATNASDGAILVNDTVFSSAQVLEVDNTVPDVQAINTPVAVQNYSGSATIVFNASVSNVSGTAIDTVFFQITNGTGINFNLTASSTNATLFNVSSASSAIADGTQTVTVYANDTAGNSNSSVSTTFRVDSGVPNVTFVNPSTAGNVSGNVTLNISVTDDVTAGASAIVNVTNSSGSILDSFTLSGGTQHFNTSWPTANGTYPDGTYNLTVEAQDTVGNINSSVINNVIVDNSNPEVGSVSVSSVAETTASISLTANDTGSSISSCTYSGAGTGSLSLSSGSYTGSLSGLLGSATYTVTVTCNDSAGNSNSSAATFDTAAAASSSSSSSGGGSGGSSTRGTGTSVKKIWSSVAAGDVVEMPVVSDDLAIEKISFTAAERGYGLWIQVEKMSTVPVGTTPFDGKSYQLLKLTDKNVDDVTGSRTIEFAVAKSWVESQGIADRDVALFRLVEGEWVALETSLKREEADHYYYSAEVAGFSFFAIGSRAASSEAVDGTSEADGEESEAEDAVEEAAGGDAGDEREVAAESAPVEEVAVEEEGSSSSSGWIVGLLVLLALIGIGWWYFGANKGSGKKRR